MDVRDVHPLVLQELGMRIGDSMAQYIARRLPVAAEPIPVIGGDARTGVPVRKHLAPMRAASEKSHDDRIQRGGRGGSRGGKN